MRYWQSAEAPDTEDVAVLLFPEFSNHCLANAIEPLRAANSFLMREAYRWEYVTLDGSPVTSSSGLPVLPARRLQDHPGGAFLFVASSYGVRQHATRITTRALKSAAGRFKNMVGMDTGAWLMAHAGLLDGMRATIHWDELTAFSEMFVDVETRAEKFLIEGNLMTCGGAMTAFDLALELIGRRHGEACRLEVAALFLHQQDEMIQGRLRPHRTSPLVQKALALMSTNLETPLPIEELSTQLECSHRALGRAFQAELGAAPVAVYKRLRLSAARRYAQQSTYSITEIALRCGYKSPASMTRAFVEQFGKTPSALRASL
ncbi:MAG: GlxA family transcriptional regulator [Pseudomonadota bacterium]